MACATPVVRGGAAATYDDVINNGEIRVSTAGVASELGSGGSDRGGAAQARARRVTKSTWEVWI